MKKKKYIWAIAFFAALIAAFLIWKDGATRQQDDIELEYSYIWSTGDTTETINVYEPGEYWVEVTAMDAKSHEIVGTKVTHFMVTDNASVTELQCY